MLYSTNHPRDRKLPELCWFRRLALSKIENLWGWTMLILLAVLGTALTVGVTYAVCRAIEGSLKVPSDEEIKQRTRVKPPAYPY